MRHVLTPDVFESLRRTRREGTKLDESVAEPVAAGMLHWAVSQGATHYLHWFQPMTDTAVGKSEAFLCPSESGEGLISFSSRALVQGEPDASSFPSGGLRNTFEARGYTAWDPSSEVFVKDQTLYIPTAFCGPDGAALDHKTPLLRSMEALSRRAVAILRLLGDTQTRRVVAQVGPEQEYFLVDRALYERRLDLKICGRTLLGAPPPKSQELDDHYYSRVHLRVSHFMHDLDEALWELGIAAQTKHSEVAPTQHELAVHYETANVSVDQNQLVMETMKEVAKRHGLACLLHEKPFTQVNGSGKHNNYSLSTDTGRNLFAPGPDPANNAVFLLFVAAFVRGVDRYASLLRLAAATPNNDHRLGGFEAPPGIISIFLGDPLTALLSAGQGPTERGTVPTRVAIVPEVLGDNEDRNRTSPLAFTGNKFEFRMPGSSQSLAFTNTVLNALICDSLDAFAPQLEGAQDVLKVVRDICSATMAEHGRVVFNGDNYSSEWVAEAARRGLPSIPDSLAALDVWRDASAVDLLSRLGILGPRECEARREVALENYCKITRIEANTLLEMMQREIIPAVVAAVSKEAVRARDLTNSGIICPEITARSRKLASLADAVVRATNELSKCLPPQAENAESMARMLHDQIVPLMTNVRRASDSIEPLISKGKWPIPTYTDLMHRV